MDGRGRRGRLGVLRRVRRAGDIPVVVMLAWAGWLAVPWSFSGLAQARAAAAAAAADAEPPPLGTPAAITPPPSPSRAEAGTAAPPGSHARLRASSSPWGIPAAPPAHPAARLSTVRTPPAGEAEQAGEAGLAAAVERAVAVERARIAGEVHDAAGHGLAAVALQAGLALVALDDDPEQARASLRAIKETSTAALAQLRAALDGIDPPGGDLAGLIGGVRAAGLPVDVEPAGLPVPAHLRDVVHRVVRESLTNVLRHAGPTRVLVRASDGPGAYVLEVADRGAGRAGAGEGRGLAGLRARVTEAGGVLTAGPRPGGGFQVTARFPHRALT
ncbi:histidine kinase [Actinomadura sp. ATCC 31491]|uniref:histidine kinase n=1 Tax=Actinomadura luzonensis TaxID=2805427 RepID=A0ABT0G7B9_9ACTN|nr:histidine kinase [Actinomadura luzonensis]MCK2220487.1 histidine kinase [Actinomadura luzonensis]